jgi:hypothetical protein
VLSRDELVETLLAQLDERERARGVVYYADELVSAESTIGAPRLDATAPWAAHVGFVDREPTANWTHSCRYLLVNPESKEVLSIEAQLPPFGPGDSRHWHVAYKAPTVPDAVVVSTK